MFYFINKCIALMRSFSSTEDVVEANVQLTFISDIENKVTVLKQYMLPEVSFVSSEGFRTDMYTESLSSLTDYIASISLAAREGTLPGVKISPYINARNVYAWLYNPHSTASLDSKLDMITSKIIIMLKDIDESPLPTTNFKRYLVSINSDLDSLVKVLKYFGETK